MDLDILDVGGPNLENISEQICDAFVSVPPPSHGHTQRGQGWWN